MHLVATFSPMDLVVWAGSWRHHDGYPVQSDPATSHGIGKAEEQRESFGIDGWAYRDTHGLNKKYERPRGRGRDTGSNRWTAGRPQLLGGRRRKRWLDGKEDEACEAANRGALLSSPVNRSPVSIWGLHNMNQDRGSFNRGGWISEKAS